MAKAKAQAGFIDDCRTYTHKQIAQTIDRTDRWVKDFILGNYKWSQQGHHGVSHANLGNGLLMVAGRNGRLAIEAMSKLREQSESTEHSTA